MSFIFQTYLDFLQKSKPGRLVIVTDPPFGGRSELISWTYKSIQKDYAELHDQLSPEKCRVELIWIFPYFMEHQVKTLLNITSSIPYNCFNYKEFSNIKVS
jgi:hypothetical protein